MREIKNRMESRKRRGGGGSFPLLHPIPLPIPNLITPSLRGARPTLPPSQACGSWLHMIDTYLWPATTFNVSSLPDPVPNGRYITAAPGTGAADYPRRGPIPASADLFSAAAAAKMPVPYAAARTRRVVAAGVGTAAAVILLALCSFAGFAGTRAWRRSREAAERAGCERGLAIGMSTATGDSSGPGAPHHGLDGWPGTGGGKAAAGSGHDGGLGGTAREGGPAAPGGGGVALSGALAALAAARGADGPTTAEEGAFLTGDTLAAALSGGGRGALGGGRGSGSGAAAAADRDAPAPDDWAACLAAELGPTGWALDGGAVHILTAPDGRPRRLGEGGFGAVYLAEMDGSTQVAVKLLSTQQPREGEGNHWWSRERERWAGGGGSVERGDGTERTQPPPPTTTQPVCVRFRAPRLFSFKPPPSPSTVRRFIGEAVILKGLRHVNIVQFLGAFCGAGGAVALVTEYLPRGDLYRLLGRDFDRQYAWWRRGRGVALDIARGVLYMHTRAPPIIHLDLKSANVLLARDFTAKIADVGLAKVLSRADTKVSLEGTFDYAAPELLSGERVSEKADVYSMGECVSMREMGDGRRGEVFFARARFSTFFNSRSFALSLSPSLPLSRRRPLGAGHGRIPSQPPAPPRRRGRRPAGRVPGGRRGRDRSLQSARPGVPADRPRAV